jgi:hypothetical protein
MKQQAGMRHLRSKSGQRKLASTRTKVMLHYGKRQRPSRSFSASNAELELRKTGMARVKGPSKAPTRSVDCVLRRAELPHGVRVCTKTGAGITPSSMHTATVVPAGVTSVACGSSASTPPRARTAPHHNRLIRGLNLAGVGVDRHLADLAVTRPATFTLVCARLVLRGRHLGAEGARAWSDFARFARGSVAPRENPDHYPPLETFGRQEQSPRASSKGAQVVGTVPR